jgi:hypothetical protein
VAGWKPRERYSEEDFSYPHPERLDLAERIAALQGTEGPSEDLDRAKKLYDGLDGVFPVWEENTLAIEAFLKVRTQWRTGAVGYTGLDYLAVERRIQRMKLAPELEERVLEDIELMETSILAEWAKEERKRARELEKGRKR